MNRLLAAAAVTTLALSGTAAQAAKKPSPRAKVWNATLAPAGASSSYSQVTGKAQVVDNKKRDSAKVQIKGALKPGALYSWAIVRVKDTGGACDPANTGEVISAFRYKDLRVNPSGNASSTAKSKTFVGLLDRRYAVVVSDEEGEVVSCGELKRKRTGKKRRG